MFDCFCFLYIAKIIGKENSVEKQVESARKFSQNVMKKKYTEQAVEYDVLMFDLRFFYNETTVCEAYLPAVYDGKAVFKLVTDDAQTVDCFHAIFQGGAQGSLKTIANVYMLLDLLYQLVL